MIKKEFNETIEARLNHPFLGTYTLITLIHNWKAVLYATTGSIEPQARIASILSIKDSEWNIFGQPFLITLFFLAIYPIANAFLESFFHYVNVKKENKKSEITNNNDFKSERLFDMATIVGGEAKLKLEGLRNRLISEINDFKYHRQDLPQNRTHISNLTEISNQFDSNLNLLRMISASAKRDLINTSNQIIKERLK